MSCNGCRVLRKGCGDSCILRPCLEWIETPQAQANATLFVSKFFGRSDLMSFVAAVTENKRPALFQSLLFEACGRTVNPVNGALGLLSTGNWHLCQAAVETVLAGGTLRQISAGILTPAPDETSQTFRLGSSTLRKWYNDCSTHYQSSDLGIFPAPPFAAAIGGGVKYPSKKRQRAVTISFNSEESEMLMSFGGGDYDAEKPKLLNLFV